MAFTNDSGKSPATEMFYHFWVQNIRKGWKHIYGEELTVSGEGSYEQHKSCLIQLRQKLLLEPDFTRWKTYFDFEPTVTVEEVIREVTIYIAIPVLAPPQPIKSAEDVTPRMFKESCYAIAHEMGVNGKSVDVELSVFLRGCLDHMFDRLKLNGRLNVGANRHFSRLYKWISEVQEETDWSEGRGFHIKPIGGRGRVAARPSDPRALKVTIKKDWL